MCADNPNSKELLDAAHIGDPDTLAGLVERHRHRLLRTVFGTS